MKWSSLGLLITCLLVTGRAHADDIEQAREAFRQGASLAKDAQWGAALASFERSAKLRASAGTTYNIAVCERALGQYVRARRTFLRALEEKKTEHGWHRPSSRRIRHFESISYFCASVRLSDAPQKVCAPE